ncbi:MAG: sigma-70 family RNA polymerase sigma factor [Bacteroidales bacterium]|nr:sigma-70 family RNA polymerase sigma factor [Bacteroidales bacterium]
MSRKEAKHIEFEQMLRRSRRILYSVCLAFTDCQPANIDDLYQEIVANLWHGWPKFRGESDPTTWVYRIALNTAGMELRKRGKRELLRSHPIDPCLLDSLAEASDPRRAELYELIDLLPDEEKKLLLLHLDHLTHAQIAQIAGTSENAVKQHLYRIRKKLIQLHKHEDGK